MKKLVIFAGPPCTGKSTLARSLGAAHLEMDAARAELLPASSHTREDREVAYRAIAWAAKLLLRYTDFVICDGGFVHSEDRRACREAAEESGAAVFVVEFTAPLAVLLERNRARRGRHPGLDLTDERVTQLVENYPWGREGILVDGTQEPESSRRMILDYLGTVAE